MKVRAFFFLTTKRILFLLSLLVFPLSADARPICLFLDASEHRLLTVPVSPGSELRVSFSHSLYGSIVEEVFTAHMGNLRTKRILYAEQRLVEFYGYESARHENGAWVVIPGHRSFKTLDLRVSPGSRMQLSLDSRLIALEKLVQPGAAVRVTADLCSTNNDGE